MSVSQTRHDRLVDEIACERTAHELDIDDAVRLLLAEATAESPARAHERLAAQPRGRIATEVLRQLHAAIPLTRSPAAGCPWCAAYLRTSRVPKRAAALCSARKTSQPDAA